MSFTVQVSHGSDKHQVEIHGQERTVAHLKDTLSELTDIPSESQKLIFKGKTLQEDSRPLCDLGIKQGSRLMVLGRKFNADQEPSLKEVVQVCSAVDGGEKKLDGIRDEITGIEKGFVQSELVADACRGLAKRCVSCGEFLMQNLEKLDAIDIPPTETLIRGKRKSAIVRIQALLKRNDDLIKRIDACRKSKIELDQYTNNNNNKQQTDRQTKLLITTYHNVYVQDKCFLTVANAFFLKLFDDIGVFGRVERIQNCLNM
uniref:BAG family molecular chaperone regulator 1 n=1 Tax=Suberites domuncula TaxID=55567 RepID=Q14RX9_SUBDO|nr:BAG family molecular chaperone regulator 1 [Suberites domuncula]